MTFETYCTTMQNHGIGELLFSYGDWKNCCVSMYLENYRLKYEILICNQISEFGSFEELVSAPLFNSFTLKEIWSEIKIISLDDIPENQYDSEIHSTNYIQCIKDFGDIQWEYKSSQKDALLFYLKFVMICPLILLAIGLILVLTKIATWYIMLLFGGCNIVVLVVAIFKWLKTCSGFYYIVTDKKVIIDLNYYVETRYEDIIKVKLKHSFFNKNQGTIKLVVKKRFSINYQIVKIKNVDDVYNLICNNIKEKKQLKI